MASHTREQTLPSLTRRTDMAISEDKKRLFTAINADGSKAGISLYETMSCLSYYKRDAAGRRNLGMIVKNADVNLWAKCKPFVKVNKTTKDEPATMQERKDADYGLSIPYAKSPVALLNYYNGEGDLNGWSRRIPRGSAYDEPFRILDFDGYRHDAPCPFVRVQLPIAAINQWQTSGFKIAIPTSSGGEDDSAIKMTDIDAIADYYFTIQIKHKNPSGNGVFIRTISAEKPLREFDGGYIEFSTYQLPKGLWDVIPFLSPVKFTTDNDGSQVPESYRYYPIPKCYAGEMTISATQYSLVYFDGFKNVASMVNPVYGFSFNFAVKNNTENTHTFNDVIVRVRFPEKSFDDRLETTETQVDIQPFTIDSGKTLDYASHISQGSMFPLKWTGVNISRELYENRTGIVVYLQLGSGQEVYKLYLRSSEADTPMYDPDKDNEPIVPEI